MDEALPTEKGPRSSGGLTVNLPLGRLTALKPTVSSCSHCYQRNAQDLSRFDVGLDQSTIGEQVAHILDERNSAEKARARHVVYKMPFV